LLGHIAGCGIVARGAFGTRTHNFVGGLNTNQKNSASVRLGNYPVPRRRNIEMTLFTNKRMGPFGPWSWQAKNKVAARLFITIGMRTKVTDAVEALLQLGFDGVGSGGGRLYSTTNQVAPEGSESTYRLARTKAGAWGK
jgi:hypothetical protein